MCPSCAQRCWGANFTLARERGKLKNFQGEGRKNNLRLKGKERKSGQWGGAATKKEVDVGVNSMVAKERGVSPRL